MVTFTESTLQFPREILSHRMPTKEHISGSQDVSLKMKMRGLIGIMKLLKIR